MSGKVYEISGTVAGAMEIPFAMRAWWFGGNICAIARNWLSAKLPKREHTLRYELR